MALCCCLKNRVLVTYYNKHTTQYSIQQGYNTFRSIPAKPSGTTHTSHEDDTKQIAVFFYRICMQCVKGLANCNPQEGHIIRYGLASGPNECIHISESRREEINPLQTKRRPLYLKTKAVPHFSSRL